MLLIIIELYLIIYYKNPKTAYLSMTNTTIKKTQLNRPLYSEWPHIGKANRCSLPAEAAPIYTMH